MRNLTKHLSTSSENSSFISMMSQIEQIEESKGEIEVARSGMDLKQFNEFMKKCSRAYGVRYVTPTIHPKFKIVVSVVLHTDKSEVKFNCTNNPDENYNLFNALDSYLNEMGGDFD